jgi:hypothetical protein
MFDSGPFTPDRIRAASALLTLQLSKLTLEASVTPAGINVTVTGGADMDTTENLRQFLSELHRSAIRLRTTEVVIDVRSLGFINSSCLTEVARWLTHLPHTAEAERYHVKLSIDTSQPWQRRSFGPLRYVAPGLVTVV